MRFLGTIATLTSWLMISTFAFPQSGESFLLSWVLAMIIAALAMVAPGRMNVRLLISSLAFILFWAAILLPDVSVAARVSNGIVAALIFAVGLVPSPVRRRGDASGASGA
jgi:uncharacterized membrane protein